MILGAGVAKAIELSRVTIRNIKQNLFWAFIYNVIGIPGAPREALRRLDFEGVFLNRKPGAPAPTPDVSSRGAGESRRLRSTDTSGGSVHLQLKDHPGRLFRRYSCRSACPVPGTALIPTRIIASWSIILKTYAAFSDHPAYAEVCARFRNSMLLKCARQG